MYIISNVIHDVFEDAIQIFLDLDGINKILDGIPSTENHTYISALNEIVGRIAEKMKGNTEVSERLFYYLRDNQPIKDKFYNYFFYTSLHDFYFLEKFICNCQENAEYVFKFIDFSELYRNLTSVNQNENGLEHLFKISRLLLKNAPKDVATYHFSRVDFAQITSFLREEKIKPQAEEELVKFLTIFFQEHHDSVLLAIQNDLIGLLKYYLRDGPVTVKVRVIQAFDNIYTIDSNTFPKDITDDNLIDMLLTLLDSDWSEIILNVVTILDKIVQKALNRKPGCGHFFEILERNDTFDSVKSLLESDDINIREAADNFLDKFDRLRNQEFELFGEDDEILYDISDNDQEYFK
ncbi:hypothetical protein GPJ56_001511 [Histomonas meleagridis]|uniref:uncharacterized protein n=1 Tax=Histomonas meleagridis TaxID=135588 RepID=UPI0035599A53|nr:hypothetical protein GPJ56_001511 [Histomonas meleagridis]KAH0807017.1 hypothetical protein GO595_000193 [Histomonas meleagridis]